LNSAVRASTVLPVGTLKEECLYLWGVCCSGGCLGIACQYVNHY